MKLGLQEFVSATRSMQQLCGIKRTRLMLRIRPQERKKIFIVKATDGRSTFTTRVEHQGQLKLLDGLVSDFIGRCTTASMPPTAAPAPHVSTNAAMPAQANAAQGNSTPAAPPAQPRAQPPSKGSTGAKPNQKKSNKGKKGKR